MKRAAWIALCIAASTVVSLAFNVSDVLAGPPLLCHPFEIGEAKSLPWGDGAWENDKINLSDEAFVAQALALLSDDADVLTRMETMRRATIHAAEHPHVAKDLMASLRARVAESDKPTAMQLFDFGYLQASYAQMNGVTAHNATGVSGGKRKDLSVSEELGAYELLKKSASYLPKDGAIEFALALVTAYPAHPAHKIHVQNAIELAPDGSLLAENLVRHFGRQGQTLTDLRSSFGMAGNGERR